MPGDILSILGAGTAAAARQTPDVFVGRQREIRALHEAYSTSAAGREVTVFVTGRSGMGKSTLIRRFLAQLDAGARGESDDGEGPLVLSGRCHARESLPYNAFDGVLDDLSHILMGLPDDRVSSLLPQDIDLLARLFPILHRIPRVGPPPSTQSESPEGSDENPRELRSRAAGALRALLAALGRQGPLLIFIDDLQWADRDSLELLVDMTGADDEQGSRVMVLGALRQESPDAGIWKAMRVIAGKSDSRQLSLGPLPATERRELIDRLAAGEEGAPGVLASGTSGSSISFTSDPDDPLWLEAGGSPLLLVELFRFFDEGGSTGDGRAFSLDQVLFQRIERLPGDARDLLEHAAVAGEPAPLWLLSRAAGVSAERSQPALTLLYASRLIQIVRPGPDHWLMPYHSRVRDAVLGHLAPDRLAAVHRGVAEALEVWPEASIDAKARHWRAAGESDKASAYLVAAAREAEDKLAFDHAADLYRDALELADGNGSSESPGGESTSSVSSLLGHLGSALELAGRSYEAAQVYERAVEQVGRSPEPDAGDAEDVHDETLRLKQLAADNWLRSGHIRRGVARLSEVFSEIGAPYARTRAGAMASFVVHRTRLRMRGLGYKTRSRDSVSPHALSRIDTLYAAATSLGLIDHLRGAVVQNRHLLTALQLGEERRICRALAVELAYRGPHGGGNTRRADALASEVLALARRLGEPHVVGVVQMSCGVAQFYSGRSLQAVETLRQCEEILSRARRAVEWERATARYMLSRAQIAIGDLIGAARTAERYAIDAERRNDVYARTMFLGIPGTLRLLVRDQPDAADRTLDSALDGWPDDAYYVAHYVEAFGRAMVRLYEGDGHAAVRLLVSHIPRIRKLFILKLPWIGSEVYTLLASAALHAGDLGRAKRAIAKVERRGMAYTAGVAAMLRASLAIREGRDDRARSQLEIALSKLEQASARHMVAACQMRLGQLIGGSEGDALVASGRAALYGLGARAPEHLLNLLAPR